MKRILLLLLAVLLILPAIASCDAGSGNQTATEPETNPDTEPTGTEGGEPQMKELNYTFDGSISEEVLINYLAHAITVSNEKPDVSNKDAVKRFILDTGAKYICRSMTVWNATAKEENGLYEKQKALIDEVHKKDPDVIFEACIFECIGKGVNDIAIPAFVFEAFGLEPENRNFRFDDMKFADGSYKDVWGKDITAPDMTNLETQMWFYYRAARYIDTGYEGLHLGQVHMIGAHDTGWKCWTKVLNLIREYASEHARRHFVLLNAHTHGIKDADGYLMFDFHMYPSRPASDITQKEHYPSEKDPQRAYFKEGYVDSIYGKSLGGKTHSGWECDVLPYLVELDNFGNSADISKPTFGSNYCWGMDEITWYANQPASYRHEFLDYAYKWVTSFEPGLSFFAMPGLRVASIYDENHKVKSYQYSAYSKKYGGFDDEETIKALWKEYDENFKAGKGPAEPAVTEPVSDKNEAAPSGSVLALTVDLNIPDNESLGFLFYRLGDLSYTIEEGDRLEYDVDRSYDVPGFGAIDADLAGGGTVRDAGVGDTDGRRSHPNTDLSDVACGKWHHRVLMIDTPNAGKTVQYLMLAAHPERKDGGAENGTYTAYYDNIVITNDGEVVKEIFTDDYRLGTCSVRMKKFAEGTLAVVSVEEVK
ncbi:MAG: hypothetical protein MJ070_06775 [Lachnospiraceae bacterium]|nr:hypothetical protein [Lachnospiraceae bacterium]